MSNISEAERWAGSPLVAEAVRRAGDGADTVDILTVLVDLMNDLEDRCPGVPFGVIFDSVSLNTDEQNQYGREQTGMMLLDQYNWPLEDIDDLFGGRDRWTNQAIRTELMRRRRGLRGEHPALPLYRAGMSQAGICRELGLSDSRVSYVIRRAMTKGLL